MSTPNINEINIITPTAPMKYVMKSNIITCKKVLFTDDDKPFDSPKSKLRNEKY